MQGWRLSQRDVWRPLAASVCFCFSVYVMLTHYQTVHSDHRFVMQSRRNFYLFCPTNRKLIVFIPGLCSVQVSRPCFYFDRPSGVPTWLAELQVWHRYSSAWDNHPDLLHWGSGFYLPQGGVLQLFTYKCAPRVLINEHICCHVHLALDDVTSVLLLHFIMSVDGAFFRQPLVSALTFIFDLIHD